MHMPAQHFINCFFLLEIQMSDNKTSEKEKETKVRGFLPFWARDLLAMKDEAEKKRTAHESSVREGS